jgi:predicted dehydrogenase
MARWRIGIVGCGLIAERRYLPEIQAMPNAEIVAVSDPVPGRAAENAERFGVPAWYEDLDDMLDRSEFEILVDTASIQAHFEINLKALQAGKHLYSQKPFTTTVEEATILIEEAKRRGLKMSVSPIRMLRPEIREAKRLIDEGAIGKVSFARCRSSHGGPEYFQYRDADPTWFYRPGAGPMLDMGVHGLHAVTGLLGPAKGLCCLSGISEKRRIARSGAFDGMVIEPEVDDNTLLMLDFGESTFAFIDSSYCVKASKAPYLEIFGSKGTIMIMPMYRSLGDEHLELYLDDIETGVRGWTEPMVPWPTPDQFEQSIGVKDLIDALEEGREPVLTAEHARHVVEILSKYQTAAREGRTVALETTF